MIFALREPPILLGLVLGFLAGIWLRVTLQRQVASGSGRLRSAGAARPRGAGRWAHVLDPYGTVAAVIAGPGWGARPDAIRRRSGTDLLMLAAALVAHAVLAAVALAAYSHWDSPRDPLGAGLTFILHGDQILGLLPFGAQVALAFGAVNIGCGLLALVPIPPLELGVVLWGRLPRSPGARRLAYRLLEEGWGVAVVLVLLLLPLAGQQPLLLTLMDDVTRALFG